jgi:hypothetical protein
LIKLKALFSSFVLYYFSNQQTFPFFSSSFELLNKNNFWWNCQFLMSSKVPPRKFFSNYCPFIAVLFMELKEFLLFYLTPPLFLDSWIKMIMPPV